ncbi:MAG: glycoside hydrolase family 66 protein [Chloroflexi bacterium]|nr:glycoside hydrolase family 66 protein [Chloroflexota bacterium]
MHVLSQIQIVSPVKLKVIITHLTEIIEQFSTEFSLVDGENPISITFMPPDVAPRGYGVELRLESASEEVLDSTSTAFDVLAHWTQSPRYGFLSDFPPDRLDIEETITTLNRYHINALQFYDWMYRHEQSLTKEEPYIDLLNRQLSLTTVNRFIASAQERNMAAMPYTAVYGASLDFYRQHPNWAMLKSNGEPFYFGEDYLVIMDIRPGSPWVEHMMSEFDQILAQTAFDGIHLDQYGDPKEGFDSDGNKYSLADPLAEFINETKVHVLAQREDGAVVFNAVTNWPIESVAPAEQDIVYIEVWPPYRWFDDLHNLIIQAQKLGHGKAVVLAAYIDPQNVHNVRLADAVIFASGGGHIELGEANAILADAYFPKYGAVGEELSIALQRYYDFTVRYQDVIGPRTQEATPEFSGNIEIKVLDTGEVINTAANAVKNKVWPIIRTGENFSAISLINLLGLDAADWKEPITDAPSILGAMEVRIESLDRVASQIWLASPDSDDLSMRPLQFKQKKGSLVFSIPSLNYWDLIVIEWEE